MVPAHAVQAWKSEDIGAILTHTHYLLVNVTIAHYASTSAVYETGRGGVKEEACPNYYNHYRQPCLLQ